MAKERGNKKDIMMNAGMAFGGGVLSELLQDMIAEKAPDMIAENPEVLELIPAGAGLAMLYFMPGKADPFAYGLIGASGAGMSDRIVGGLQGFNRLTLQGDAENYRKGREYVEELINEGFGKKSGMNGFEEDDNHDGMG